MAASRRDDGCLFSFIFFIWFSISDASLRDATDDRKLNRLLYLFTFGKGQTIVIVIMKVRMFAQSTRAGPSKTKLFFVPFTDKKKNYHVANQESAGIYYHDFGQFFHGAIKLLTDNFPCSQRQE